MSQQTICPPSISSITEHEPGKSATFIIEPLMTGYGQTLANSLRRVLLSSISGAAPISFRIEGVEHEFRAIPGVTEDALAVKLNLMGLRFEVIGDDLDEPLIVHINKQGSGPVTGADVQTGGRLNVINPDHIVCHLDGADDQIAIEIKVAQGRGYLTLEDSNDIQSDKAADFIVVDAHFCPVRRVRYKIDSTRVGQMTNLDKINLTVDTDGSMTPQAALEEAAAILQEHYTALAGSTTVPLDDFSNLATPEPPEPEDPNQLDPSETDQRLLVHISDLSMSNRTINAFIRAGLNQIKDVINYSDTELNQIPQLGAKGISEFKERLKEMGF